MLLTFKTKTLITSVIFIGIIIGAAFAFMYFRPIAIQDNCIEPETIATEPPIAPEQTAAKEYIKWAQFDVTHDLMVKAYNYDVKSVNKEVHLNWIELLSYAVAKNYGNVDKKVSGYIDECAKKLNAGEKIEDLTANMKYYPFYREVYESVLGGFLKDGKLQVYSPIAKNRSFSHYKDFGASRSYGFKRKHLGNDLMGAVGTPIIAVEDGTIEAMGWNQYGGWRVGIRSGDGRRYYYYAHLRKTHPFNNKFKEGDTVKAGEVIGYLGMSGYSTKEGVNNIETPHLHFGLQLIFDESQKEGTNQIWVDVYHIVEFLQKNKSEIVYDETTKDWNKKS